MSFFGVFSGDNDEADQPLESNETLFQEMLSKARLDAAGKISHLIQCYCASYYVLII